MNQSEISRLFDQELEQAQYLFEFRVPIYFMGFNRRKRALGICRYSRQNDDYSIELSENIVRCSDEQIIDTIRHEIAHAIAGNHNGHNRVWKSVARRLGANPKACTSDDNFQKESDFNWYLVNKLDLSIVGRYIRKPRREFSKLMLRGKPETLGKLVVVRKSEYDRFIATIDREAEKVKAARAA